MEADLTKTYRVAFATGSRADYGIVRQYLSLLQADDDVSLDILAIGAMLDPKFGRAVDLVKQDGFHIAHTFDMEVITGSTVSTLILMSLIQEDFGMYFEDHKYDLLILLGDRYEMLPVAIAAAMQRIPILHLHGGEMTLANYDEFIRHSITKMSTYHITSTEEYRHRVIQLGERPDHVWCLGALGAENCLHIDLAHVPEELRVLDDTFTVLFHPETLGRVAPEEQIEEVLKAVEHYLDDYHFVFIGSNADTHSDRIASRVEEFCAAHPVCSYYTNLHPDAFHHLVKHSVALMGNSSSGIIEAPVLGTLTLNIGDRQTGRVKGDSIIDVPCVTKDIVRGMRYAIDHRGQASGQSPYFQPHTAERYHGLTRKLLAAGAPKEYKRFYDIK